MRGGEVVAWLATSAERAEGASFYLPDRSAVSWVAD